MEAYALTDTGRVRSMNQDYIYASPEKVGSLPDLFLVADGMGGHKAGDYASRFMVENLVVYLTHRHDGPCVTQIKEGLKTVNKALYDMSLEREEFYSTFAFSVSIEYVVVSIFCPSVILLSFPSAYSMYLDSVLHDNVNALNPSGKYVTLYSSVHSISNLSLFNHELFSLLASLD